MAGCRATKANGEPCKGTLWGAGGYCWHHDPKNAAQARRNALRGGRGKTNKEVRFVKQLMDELTTKVLAGDVEPAVSHAVVALQNIKLRSIEIERRLDEADVRAEFEELKRELGIS